MKFASYEEAVAGMIRWGQWIMEHHLTWGSAGNMSVRISEEQAVVTASGTRFDALREEDFALCDIATGQFTGRKPSKELPCHLGLYRRTPWAGAAVHVSPFYTTLAASSDLEIPQNLFVENMYYLQRIERVDYAHPGSNALACAIEEAGAHGNIILMKNHGVMVYDTSLQEACTGLEVLENSCRMALEAKRAGITLQGVSDSVREDFLLRSGYKPARPWPQPSNPF